MKRSGNQLVSVLLPVPVDEPFAYLWRDPRPPLPGTLVEVGFGARRLRGVVWSEERAADLPPRRLRPVEHVFDLPPLPQPLLQLLAHLARETLTPLGAALRLALPVPAALDPPRSPPVYAPARVLPAAVASPARRRVLELLAQRGPMPAAAIAEAASVSPSLLRAMVKAGLLEPSAPAEPPPPTPDPDHPGLELTPQQAESADALRARVAARDPRPVLLEGVPGSGKTEVYLEAVAETLRLGRPALVLLPEIALSTQWVERFRRRFGAPPLVWHSGLTAAQRRRSWRQILHGAPGVVVGTRSALFLPLRDLGLLVLDEEQDASFKQEDGVLYDARLMARVRARLEPCPLLLVSATPSVETAYHAARVPGFTPPGTPWLRLRLSTRIRERPMPAITLLDLRRESPGPGRFLAPALRAALRETLDAGAQALLFLNRRGYAPLSLCRACGSRLRCPNCSAWLTLHRLRRRLVCHHCGWRRPEPDHCPHCGAVAALVPCGPGVERIAEELAELLPGARLRIVTSDTVRTAADAEALLRLVEAGEVDLLVGTQMLAKGHHFPALTLVGVVDADLGLQGGDLRAAERSFQLLYQVAGRAGRGTRPGRVLVQTYNPAHPVMQALARADLDGFFRAELEERRQSGMPPFGRLAALVISGRDAAKVSEHARSLVRAAPEREGIMILGPAPAPLSLLRGRYRERILVRADAACDLPAFLRCWLAGIRLPSGLRLRVDVDPQSFL